MLILGRSHLIILTLDALLHINCDFTCSYLQNVHYHVQLLCVYNIDKFEIYIITYTCSTLLVNCISWICVNKEVNLWIRDRCTYRYKNYCMIILTCPHTDFCDILIEYKKNSARKRFLGCIKNLMQTLVL